MGKSADIKVGDAYYSGRYATDWERLKKLEAEAKKNDEALFALVDAVYEENETKHYMPYIKQAAEKGHPLSNYILAKDLPDWSFRRFFLLKKAAEGDCVEAKSQYNEDKYMFWVVWLIIIAVPCFIIGLVYYIVTRFIIS